jgi:hypothetical protein
LRLLRSVAYKRKIRNVGLPDTVMIAPSDAVATYILAKDGNRPFLMSRAFADNAELEMVVKTDAISFPGAAQGVKAIADILVHRFGIDCENVYTFCLSRPSDTEQHRFACHWLVGMSARSDGQVRVGCGRYDWTFGPGGKVEKLVIVIEAMTTFPATELAATMNWLSGLPYPWCTPGEVVKGMPKTEGFAAIEAYIREAGPILPDR